MDMFTIGTAIVVIMLSIQFQQNWLAFGIIVLLIISMRSLAATVVLIASLFFLFFTKEAIGVYWPIAMFALMIVAYYLDSRAAPAKPDYLSAGFGGLGGGGGGGF